MKKFIILFAILFSYFSYAQRTIPDILKKYNKNSVEYITVEELKKDNKVLLLDTREPAEFEVSHLNNAVYVGHSKFDSKSFTVQFPDKNAPIVVYCSLGVRSENIGEKLIKLGYSNVKNLYGGIFEWKNQGYEVINNEGKITEEVHAFSKMWGKYLIKGIKIYNKK